MRRTLIISCLIVAALLVTSAAPAVTGEEEVAPPQQSEDESQRIAVAFILSSPTFTRDGREDTLRLVATTALEQPFSWQFEYEFQCGTPGYGRMTPRPAPIIITSHRAEIVVQEGKVISAVLDDKWNMLQQRMIGATPEEEEAVNLVSVGFSEGVQSWFGGDTFTNSELTGLRNWRIGNILNTDDATGAPVKDLRVTLESELDFDGVGSGVEGSLTKMGPPIYEWSFGDLVEESQHKGTWIDAAAWFDNYPSTVTPGFDASRSFDKTLFTAPDTQTLTITVTPREEWLKLLGVEVIADEKSSVDPVITSYSPTSAENIKFTPDKHRLFMDCIPVKLNTPLTITVTLLVTPKVAKVDYKPCVGVWPETQQVEPDVGTTRGSSVSYTMPEVGTWTVSGEGNYLWNWGAPRWVRGSVLLAETPEPRLDPVLFADTPGPSPGKPAPPASAATNWLVVIGIAAGLAIVGLAAYFFIRRRKRRVA